MMREWLLTNGQIYSRHLCRCNLVNKIKLNVNLKNQKKITLEHMKGESGIIYLGRGTNESKPLSLSPVTIIIPT